MPNSAAFEFPFFEHSHHSSAQRGPILSQTGWTWLDLAILGWIFEHGKHTIWWAANISQPYCGDMFEQQPFGWSLINHQSSPIPCPKPLRNYLSICVTVWFCQYDWESKRTCNPKLLLYYQYWWSVAIRFRELVSNLSSAIFRCSLLTKNVDMFDWVFIGKWDKQLTIILGIQDTVRYKSPYHVAMSQWAYKQATLRIDNNFK